MPPSPRGFPPAPPRHWGQPRALPLPVPVLLGALPHQSWGGLLAVLLLAAAAAPSAELLGPVLSPGLQSLTCWTLLLLLGAGERTGSSHALTSWRAVRLWSTVASGLPCLVLGCPAEAG